jgi:magnesium transporter
MTLSDSPQHLTKESSKNKSSAQKRRESIHARKAGLPPGALFVDGEAPQGPARVSVIQYNETTFTEKRGITVAEAVGMNAAGLILWINIDGVHDTTTIKEICNAFKVHPLSIEDIVTVDQRSKRDITDEYEYLVFKMIERVNNESEMRCEQVSLIIGEGFVLTFQENPDSHDVFEAIRNRLRNGRGNLRKSGADYLTYALLDAVVDIYFVVLEELGEDVEEIERRIIDEVPEDAVRELYKLKRQLLTLRRSAWPLREMVTGLEKDTSQFVRPATQLYLKDVRDHLIHIIDHTEQLREMLSSLLEIYLSSVSNRLNTVMKFLTLVSTIFLPLTFIAGVYGMNFHHMPELSWEYGYPFAIGLMLAVAGGMLLYFKIRKWL